MKKLLFLLLPVVLFSCGKGVEQHRASIETLATDWDATTSAVTEFQNTLNGDLSSFSQLAGSLRLGDDVKMKLKPEQVAQWDASQGAFTQALQGFAPIRTQVAEFSKAWGEKAVEVQALKDGLAAGKLEGDVNAKVAELSALVAQAKEQLAGWQAAHAAAKSATQTAGDAMKVSFETLNAAPVAGKK